MTEQYEPIDPYANPIDDDTAAAMVAESKALYEIVQDASKWDGYIEDQVDDLAVVEMSTAIAEQVSDEMTFPGQIKVTVIRAFEATATAN